MGAATMQLTRFADHQCLMQGPKLNEGDRRVLPETAIAENAEGSGVATGALALL
jgi:hypothetical protein